MTNARIISTNRTESTTWEVWSYDVGGNEDDGYEVNDRYCQHPEYKIDCPIEIANASTPYAFEHTYPTDAQIREALDLGSDC